MQVRIYCRRWSIVRHRLQCDWLLTVTRRPSKGLITVAGGGTACSRHDRYSYQQLGGANVQPVR